MFVIAKLLEMLNKTQHSLSFVESDHVAEISALVIGLEDYDDD